MASFPSDEFDDLPHDLHRVGAHRAPRPRGRGWIAFAWAALATGVLVAGGLFGLSLLNPDIDLVPSGSDAGATETSAPGDDTADVEAAAPTTTDPLDETQELEISVLNGSAAEDAQETAGDALRDAGWTDPGRANATARDEPTTIVYYWSAEYEAIALGVAATLGVGTVQVSDAFPGAPITVVLGQDYADTLGG